MWDLQILGEDFYHIANWFFIYSFLGWLWESSYVSVKEKRLVNRGFVTGPVCTIYGFGAVIVYLILKPVSGNIVFLYLGGVVFPTILEYFTAVLMETIFHTSWWDYSNNRFNFQGRICLGASVLCSASLCGKDCGALFRGCRKSTGQCGSLCLCGGFRHVFHECDEDSGKAGKYGSGYGRALRIYPVYEAL